MKSVLGCAFLLSIVFSVSATLAQAGQKTPAHGNGGPSSRALPFRNTALPIDVRADDLVSRMTIEEMAGQMVHTAPAIPRLGIPAYNWWSEGLHGVGRTGYATVFPQAIGLAASFDPALLKKEAAAIAVEFRVKYDQEVREKGYSDWYHGLTVWSPNINIFRDPRWGRGQETYGEDPFLTAQMGTAYVTGLQGSNPKYLEALSTPKHFAVHSGPESTRHTVDVSVSRHDLEDTYLPAFRATVTAGAGSVMCAYNSVDGKPACAQPMLLQEHLRDAWHFSGYVVSDCGAASDISEGHHYVQTMEQGVAAAVKAGMDIVCGMPMSSVDVENNAILAAVKEGLLSKEDVTRAVRRLFAARIRLGMFDPPSTVPFHPSSSENDSAEHQRLAHTAARESLVLLKNAGNILPLGEKYRNIAVIGPNADSVDPLLGNYNGTPSHPVTVLEGIRQRFKGGANVSYAAGSSLTGKPLSPIPSKFLRDASGMPGLNAAYFKGTGLKGKPAATRTDMGVDFWWRKGINSEMSENFSVRWTGTLIPTATGDYGIGFTGTDAFHFWLDGQLIGESSYSDTSKTRAKTIHLNAGQTYAVKIECEQKGSSGVARLVWHEPQADKDYAEVMNKSDLIVAVLGLAGELEGEEMPINVEGFSGGDRTSLDLPRAQRDLLEDLVASGKPVVVVLMNGSALSVNWADEHAQAILEAWYPGEAGGAAVAEALAGDFSPGGKLPLTFYKSVDQLPPFDDYNMKGRTYRYFTGEPLYPFGYGLSYTTFEYSNLKFDSQSVDANGDLNVSVEVKNSGKMAGDEVVQLYLTHPTVEGAPVRALAGFKRVHISAGSTTNVQITIPNRQLSVVDAAGIRRIVPGEVKVWVGGGQPMSRGGLLTAPGLAGSIQISGEATLPE